MGNSGTAAKQFDEAPVLLSQLKRDGLVTQRKDGTYHLRSYGRAALIALATIAAQEQAKEAS
jgi:hypothetical protein